MKLVYVLAFAAAGMAACVDSPATATQGQELDWRCVNVCWEGFRCQSLCTFEENDRVVVTPAAPSCDDLRPINQCGDGCCDNAESVRYGEYWCPTDCKVLKLAVDWSEGEWPKLYYKDNAIGEWQKDSVYLDTVNACY